MQTKSRHANATTTKNLTTVTQFELSNAIRKSKLFSKIKLAPTSRLVLESLVFHYPKIRVYIETLQDETGNSRRSVDNAINELRQKELIITTQTGRSLIFELTAKFFELIEITQQSCKKESIRHAENTCPHNKQNNIQTKKTNFSFKNLNELLKNNPVEYQKQVNKLSHQDKQKLLKLKLGRTNLTDFQLLNIDKFIMLSEEEINYINKKEPYHRQENIDIYYSRRLSTIRKMKENQELKETPKTPVNERDEVLSRLKCGYKIHYKNQRQLLEYLNRNKNLMEKFNIAEKELKTSYNLNV